MRIDAFRLAVLGLATASLIPACADESAPQIEETISADGARIIRARPTGPITNPSLEQRVQLVRGFLKTDADLKVQAEIAVDGLTHVQMGQEIGGLRVHGAYVKAAVSDSGELMQVIEKLAPPTASVPKATVSSSGALASALANLGFTMQTPGEVSTTGNFTMYAKGSLFHREPAVERVAYVDANGAVRQGYLVETWIEKSNQLDETLIDADGRVLSVENRTASDSYRVFLEDPGKGGQVVVNGPGSTTASPSGWLNSGSHRSIDIAGNNVRSYLDAVSDNVPDPGGSTVGDGNFLATANLAEQPSTATNRDVAVQNLFYLNNIVHDRLYDVGFNEAAGNFQRDNFGRGGRANDPVNAEAQDGGGLDNANFATPRDGSSPRMQMYLWSGSAPNGELTVGSAAFGAFGSAFGPPLTAAGAGGALTLVDDGTGTTSDGCEASPAGSLSGRVALVDRGTCAFTIKVKNAQLAGAVAVVIANNTGGDSGAFGPGGEDATITIPSGMVTQNDGATLKTLVGSASNLHLAPVEPLKIDGDLDSDIVYHEYGHGLTWRMIGQMSGALSGAIGEGSSDTLAFLINGDDAIGEYSFDNTTGIRRFPYEGYPLTLKDVTGEGVHNDGEIYAAAMWNVLSNYLAGGLTAQDTLRDWVQGMNFTPSAPSYEEMRDGMLQAVGGDAARQCHIWRGFAKQGIGVGAKSTKRGSKLVVTESLVVPAQCQ